MNPLLLIPLSAAALGLLAWLSYERVEDGKIAVLRRFGRTRKVLLPGAHLVVPFLDRVERRLDTIGRSIELKDHRVPGTDAGVQVDGRVFYQILDARQAVAELEHLEDTVTEELDRLLPALLTEHRNQSSEAFNSALKQSLNARLRLRGILVARTQIQAAA
jgi:regulator of protease activity HflC (stomatin/prohibitin superfamily)